MGIGRLLQWTSNAAFNIWAYQAATNSYQRFGLGHGVYWSASGDNYIITDTTYNQATFTNENGVFTFAARSGALSSPQTYAAWHAYNVVTIGPGGLGTPLTITSTVGSGEVVRAISGETSDLLPVEKEELGDARWDELVHTGGMEVGMMEWPAWTGMLRLADFEARVQKPYDFLELPTDRWMHQEYSPPLIFRTISAGLCSIGRLGLDFWKARTGGPRSTSFFSHVNSLTVPGRDGALPTLRFQMLREKVQDWEIKRMLVAAYLKLPDDKRAPYRAVLNELSRRVDFGTPFYLSQSELQFDWLAYVATLHETAADLLGAKSTARWAEPPLE